VARAFVRGQQPQGRTLDAGLEGAARPGLAGDGSDEDGQVHPLDQPDAHRCVALCRLVRLRHLGEVHPVPGFALAVGRGTQRDPDDLRFARLEPDDRRVDQERARVAQDVATLLLAPRARLRLDHDRAVAGVRQHVRGHRFRGREIEPERGDAEPAGRPGGWRKAQQCNGGQRSKAFHPVCSPPCLSTSP
jgi:hypothetical protein